MTRTSLFRSLFTRTQSAQPFRRKDNRNRPGMEQLEERCVPSVFVGADTATQGNWQGVYGAQGYDIANSNPILPSYAKVSLSGQQTITWAASTTDVRALQNGSTRLATTWDSATSFTVNLKLTDGATHQLAIYAVDWDNQGRSEKVQLLKQGNMAVLDSRTLTGFSGGEYLVWDVSGNVTIQVTNLSGPNAVLSGLFLDPVPTASAPLAQTFDSSTAIADGTGSDSFGSSPVGTAVTKTFTVKNAGTASLTLGPSITLPAGFALTTGFASTTLAPGASTTFTVQMKAATAGSYSGMLSFTTNDTINSPYTFTISGTVTAPLAQVFDGSTAIADGTGSDSFGSSPVGTAVSKTFTVKNAGTASLPLGPSVTLPAGFALTSGFASTTLAPGASTTFTVQMTAAAAGSYSGTLSFTTNDTANNPFTFTISGTVTAPLAQVFDGSTAIADGSGSDSFGSTTTGTPVSKTFTVKNVGTAPLTLGSSITLPSGFTLSSGFGSTTLAAGASTTFTVQMTATAAGNYNGTVSFTTNDTTNNPFTFTIGGTVNALAVPLAQVSDGTTAIADGTGSDNFGSTTTGTPVSKTFTVKNAGTAPLTLGSSITLPNGFTLASGFGSTTLAAGASTTFTVQMTAATAGSYSGTVSFTTNDTANNPFTFSISGTVTTAGSSAATFVRADTTTQGSWQGVFGGQGYDIAQGGVSLPSFAQVTLSGQQNWTWASSTSDTRAVQNGSTRLAATWYSSTSFTVGLNLTDSAQHQLGIYALDWDNQGRTEQVQLINPASGAVLDSRTLTGFSGGEYLVWDVTGNMQIKVTDLSGPNAVLTGLFLDTTVPLAQVFDGSTAIADKTGSDSFGSTTVGTPVSKTFTVTNLGTAPLILGSSISLPTGFTLSSGFGSTTLAAGASTTFTVQMTAGSAGSCSGTVSFTTNDSANNPYTFTISGTSQNFVSDPYITTPYLKIPNFGANPTIFSVQSGNWSNPATWSSNRVPQAGDIVDINSWTTVIYDLNDATDSVPLNTVAIQPNATLTFRTNINTQICVGNFLVLQGGSLIVGTATNPIAANVHANIDIANQAINTAIDPQQFGTGLIVLGNVTMHGAAKTPYVTLAQEAHAGDTVLHLASPAAGWQVGDDPLLPDTQQFTDTPLAQNGYTPQWERVTIKSISADGLTVTLTAPLQYDHLGARDANGVLDYLPQVVNDSRNIMVESQSMTGTRGYTLFTARANVDIEYAGFCELGRTTNDQVDNTTFGTDGSVTHIGTNQGDRCAMTMLDLFGPTTPQANGYQFTLVGDQVDNDGDGNPNNPSNIRWGIVLNNSDYGLVQSNVVIAVAGAGIVTETGSESYNVIDSNLVAIVTGTGSRGDDRSSTNDYGFEGAGFWFRGGNNYVTNNVATDCTMYGYSIMASNAAVGAAPAYQGADPSVAGQSFTIDPEATPLLQFSGNEAYGATTTGLTIWNIGVYGAVTPVANMAQSVVKDFVVWNQSRYGFYGYPTQNFLFEHFVARGETSTLSNQNTPTTGLFFSDYMTMNFVVDHADIQGENCGILAPPKVGDVRNTGQTPQPFTVQNSYLCNYADVVVYTMWAVTGGGGNLAPRQTILTSDTFAQVNMPNRSDAPQMAIDMLYTGNSQTNPNVIQLDQVFVYNYNGISGDNFQVYYTQQAPSFVLPQSGNGLVGAPLAGLTNLQSWGDYGIAFAGALLPATATTQDLIVGYVNPI